VHAPDRQAAALKGVLGHRLLPRPGLSILWIVYIRMIIIPESIIVSRMAAVMMTP